MMSRRFLIISSILIFVISPLSAWLLVNARTPEDTQPKTPDINVQHATKSELLHALQTQHKVNHFQDTTDTAPKILSIDSFKNFDIWWYVVNVRVEGETDTQPVIVSKFYDGTGAINIITNPGESLRAWDMSDSLGIPYDVIDSYNNLLAEAVE